MISLTFLFHRDRSTTMVNVLGEAFGMQKVEKLTKSNQILTSPKVGRGQEGEGGL